MKTVTICGSMKFSKEMKQIAFELESIEGYNVLQCTYNDLNMEITPEMFENLKQSHFGKIDMSDMIYVVDVNGYVGDSVKQEIEYAKKHHKEVVFYSKRLEVKFYDTVEDSLLKFAVIISKTNGKWVFCKHKERTTFEVPGGHREKGETILETAKRELREETGATDFTIEPVCIYSVKGKTRINENMEDETFGMLFAADIFSFEELHNEIEKILITDTLVESWTYPLIQPKLIEEARKRGCV